MSTLMRSRARVVLLATALLVSFSPKVAARTFSLTDEIGLADFGDIGHSSRTDQISWSPDQHYIAIHAGRGLVGPNRVESELRIYEAAALRAYLASDASTPPPNPLWTIKNDYREGPGIQSIRWTSRSDAVTYLNQNDDSSLSLRYADIGTRTVTTLSGPGQDVSGFDVVDSRHYVYAVKDISVDPSIHMGEGAATVLTGQPLTEILFPLHANSQNIRFVDRSIIWARDNGPVHQLDDPVTHRPITIFSPGTAALRMSPDGGWVVTAVPLATVPAGWSRRFPPPGAGAGYAIKDGPQTLDRLFGRTFAERYVLIDTKTGNSIVPIDAPLGQAAAWWTDSATPAWSAKGDAVLLSNVFLPNEDAPQEPARPCLAYFSLSRRRAICVDRARPRYKPDGSQDATGYEILRARFSDAQARSIDVDSQNWADDPRPTMRYIEQADGGWKLDPLENAPASAPDIKVLIKQSYESPPVAAVSTANGLISRTFWDPNPQLADIALGKVEELRWSGKDGRSYKAGLFLPPDYDPAKTYPLVIQAHGFFPNVFRPSGLFQTGYAARVLAADGIIVLQTRCTTKSPTLGEGSCETADFESAVAMLSQKSMIDVNRIGIIGFSRTCLDVLKALTFSNISFKAASITDGINSGYWQAIMNVDYLDNALAGEMAVVNGGPPFGPTLENWLKISPMFNFDKVNTPLQVVGEGIASLATMWEPYALLRLQHKPVDLILLNTDEHVLTTPAVRLASQGGAVDWMRYWLQGYEDPDPAKTEQYRRWDQLRRLQRTGTAPIAPPQS